MVDDGPEKVKLGKEGDDEMTVVVPPPKGSKLSGEPGNYEEGDVAMDNAEAAEAAEAAGPDVDRVDPKVKAVAGQS